MADCHYCCVWQSSLCSICALSDTARGCCCEWGLPSNPLSCWWHWAWCTRVLLWTAAGSVPVCSLLYMCRSLLVWLCGIVGDCKMFDFTKNDNYFLNWQYQLPSYQQWEGGALDPGTPQHTGLCDLCGQSVENGILSCSALSFPWPARQERTCCCIVHGCFFSVKCLFMSFAHFSVWWSFSLVFFIYPLSVITVINIIFLSVFFTFLGVSIDKQEFLICV